MTRRQDTGAMSLFADTYEPADVLELPTCPACGRPSSGPGECPACRAAGITAPTLELEPAACRGQLAGCPGECAEHRPPRTARVIGPGGIELGTVTLAGSASE